MKNPRGVTRAPSPEKAFARARVNIASFQESIWQPFYDYQTLPAAGSSAIRFFQVPQGQGGKTLVDTNMELPGSLPKGQAFLVTGVQVELYPGATILDADGANQFQDDIYNFYKSGYLTLTVGSKKFLTQGNLMKFPPVNRLANDSATGAANSYNYATAAGREFAIQDLLLESSQNFNVELNDLSSVSVDARIGVTLNGYLYRNAQ